MNFSQIYKGLIECDDKILNLSTICSLLNIVPTQLELQTLNNYEGDKDDLGNPEIFFITIKNVPGFEFRLESMKFDKLYKEMDEDLDGKIEELTKVLINLRNNSKLQLILTRILAIGNYLNGNSMKGGAFGFKLEALEKVSDMKMNNEKVFILKYFLKYFFF